MNLRDINRLNYYVENITNISTEYQIPGLNTNDRIQTLARQCLDSEKRIRYIRVIGEKDLDESVLDPNSIGFDPIKASSLLLKKGEYDEAVWMCFLGIHFGKHKTMKWSLLRAVYGMLGERLLTWEYITENINEFRLWLTNNEEILRQEGKFSNHRRYVSIKNSGTGRAFSSYIDWIGTNGHQQKFEEILNEVGDNPNEIFDHLYKEMDRVYSYDRLGKFDFLCMLGKSNLINIEPGHAYLKKATGPNSGLSDLLRNTPNDEVSMQRKNDFMQLMADAMPQDFVMQILEDAICNWQKSPENYEHFSG